MTFALFDPLLLACFAGGLVGSALLVPLCRSVARRRKLVASPQVDRWHDQPTALLGGIGIVIPVLVGSVFILPAGLPWVLPLSGALIFAFGLIDDIIPLKPSTKLVAQIMVGSLLLYFNYRLGWFVSLTLDTVLTLVWIVGITNAFNLLDNMDGLCAGTAIIAGLSLLFSLAGIDGAAADARYIALVVGATSGFLFYNLRPASIFMGDSGSLFIGLTLAAVSVRPAHAAEPGSSVLSVVLAPVLVLLVPILDTTMVTFARLMAGRRPSQGGKDHSSHRLVAIGLSESRAVSVLWILAACGGLMGIAAEHWIDGSTGLVSLIFVLATIVFAVYLARVKIYDEVVERSPTASLLLADMTQKRWIVQVALDFCLVAIAYNAAYRLRFEGHEYGVYFPVFLESLPIVVGMQMAAMFLMGAYRGVWTFFGVMDAVTLAKSVLAGTIGIVVAVLYMYRFEGYSQSVFIIYAIVLYIMVCASRASFKVIEEFARRRSNGQRIVVYGADEGAMVLLQNVAAIQQRSYRLLGFADDSPRYRGAHIKGYPVLGRMDILVELIRTGGVDHVVVASDQLDAAALTMLRDICASHKVELSRMSARFESLHLTS